MDGSCGVVYEFKRVLESKRKVIRKIKCVDLLVSVQTRVKYKYIHHE